MRLGERRRPTGCGPGSSTTRPRFKLDATADWTEELIAELEPTGAVDSVDFKGQYRGTKVDTVPDPALYGGSSTGSPTPGSRIPR